MNKFIDLIGEGGEVINRRAEKEWLENGEKILTRGGIAGMAVSGIWMARKTNNISELLKETKADIQKAKESGDKKAIRKAKANRTVKVGKHYILPTAGMLLSAMAIDNGMAKAGGKIAGLTTLVAIQAKDFKNYRKNVISEYGEEVDRKFMTTTKAKGKISEIEMSDGTKIANPDPDSDSGITLQMNPNAFRILYSRETTPDVWHDNYHLRIATLDSIESELSVMMIANPSLTLNEMRRKFGPPKKMDVKFGNLVGRIYDPGNPNQPEAGRRVNLHFRDDKDFMEGRTDWCWIILEVDSEPLINREKDPITEIENY